MLDVLGYAASVVVILSLMMSSILWLRILNLTGTALWSFYGAAIGAMPILVVNVILVGVNFYYLVRMVAKKESFHLLEVDADSTYLRHFVERSAADIRRFAPSFDATPRPDQITLFVLRDLSPAGLFIGDLEPGGALRVRVDYVLPQFRDFKVGRYLFEQESAHLKNLGIERLLTHAGPRAHQRYLTRMGFVRDSADELGQDVFVRPLT
ncbi:MAG: hypothetical protein ACREM1_22430 [Longimicrobiales bacterium]